MEREVVNLAEENSGQEEEEEGGEMNRRKIPEKPQGWERDPKRYKKNNKRKLGQSRGDTERQGEREEGREGRGRRR